jgi:predicted ATPase
LTEYRLSGGRADLSWYLATLATALHRAGHTQEAFATLAQAEEYVAESGEAWWAAEIARLKGDFCLSDFIGQRSYEAEANYRRALDIAQRQQAKSWQLRCAVSLARLLFSRDRKSEADRLLRPIFEEFADRGNTPDIKQANALLDDLSHGTTLGKS